MHRMSLFYVVKDLGKLVLCKWVVEYRTLLHNDKFVIAGFVGFEYSTGFRDVNMLVLGFVSCILPYSTSKVLYRNLHDSWFRAQLLG